MKKILVIAICMAIVLGTCTVMAGAGNPQKLIVNGKEIKTDVSPQLINGRTMVPIRWVAQALGADVQWNEDAVHISGLSSLSDRSISRQQVAEWIKNQGKDEDDSYFIEGLSYDLVNIDADDDFEVVAKIDGAVHLGQFFIFNKNSDGGYQLTAEKDWKVENWDFDNPIEIEGKRIFGLVTRTGGTGIDVFNVHLCYLDKGNFIEAWQGTMQECSVFQENYYQKVCGYQVDHYSENKRLYAWETTLQYQLEQDGVTPKGEKKTATTTKVYLFNGTTFIQEEAEKADQTSR